MILAAFFFSVYLQGHTKFLHLTKPAVQLTTAILTLHLEAYCYWEEQSERSPVSEGYNYRRKYQSKITPFPN